LAEDAPEGALLYSFESSAAVLRCVVFQSRWPVVDGQRLCSYHPNFTL